MMEKTKAFFCCVCRVPCSLVVIDSYFTCLGCVEHRGCVHQPRRPPKRLCPSAQTSPQEAVSFSPDIPPRGCPPKRLSPQEAVPISPDVPPRGCVLQPRCPPQEAVSFSPDVPKRLWAPQEMPPPPPKRCPPPSGCPSAQGCLLPARHAKNIVHFFSACRSASGE